MNNPGGLEIVPEVVVEEHFSLLGLFHPDGASGQSVLIGSNRLQRLLPNTAAEGGQEAGLILWAPDEAECRERGWLERSAREIGRLLTREGLVYALIPRPWRGWARQLLKAQGLQPGPYFLHLPDGPSSRYLVPLQWAAAHYAFLNLFPTRLAVRTLALTLLRVPGGKDLLGALLPWTGFVAQRPGSRAAFDWLFRLAGAEQSLHSALLSASWRKDRCSAVLHCFSGTARPTAVAKLVWPMFAGSDLGVEYSNLSMLGETARQAGARVPQPGSQGRVGGYPVFLQSVLAGRSAAAIWMGHPEGIATAIAPILNWLEAWNVATRVLLPLDRDRLDRELLAASRVLAPLLPDGNEYAAWLAQRCAVLSAPVPFVAAHNDLTLWNVLLQPGSPPGIVDWGEARAESLPLVDFFYLLVDAVAVAHRLDRERAFLECFSLQGRYLPLAKHLTARYSRALEIPAGMLDLCLHACFLRHAANEQHARGPEDPQPFLNILSWLVQNRTALESF